MPKALVVRITSTATSMPIARKNALRRLSVPIYYPTIDYKSASRVVSGQNNCSHLHELGTDLLI
jgi:hypothetical protein